MNQKKFHPLILIGLLFSATSMGIFSYQHFIDQNTGYFIIFTILTLFLLTLVLTGAWSNKKRAAIRQN